MVAGKNPDNVEDEMEWHLVGSAIAAFCIVTIYGMLLFRVPKKIPYLNGIAYSLVLILTFLFNIWAGVMLMINDCTDTNVYYMAIISSVTQLVLTILTVTVILIMTICGLKSRPSSSKVQDLEHNEPQSDPKPSTSNTQKAPINKDGEKWDDDKSNKEEQKSQLGNSWDNFKKDGDDEDEDEVY